MQPLSPLGKMVPAPPLPPGRKGQQTSSVLLAADKGPGEGSTPTFFLSLSTCTEYQVATCCLLSEGPSDLRNATRSGARRLLPFARCETCLGDGAAAGRSRL